ncbi:MAG: hypothetical protein Q9157_004056 [Trypethelium eluteriae]
MFLDFAWLSATLLIVSIIPSTSQSELAPCLGHNESLELVPDSYIVKLKDNHTLEAHLHHIGFNISSPNYDYSYIDILPGYHVKANQSIVDNLIRKDAGVEWVECDSRADLPKTLQVYPRHTKKWNQRLKRWAAITMSGVPFNLAMQSTVEKMVNTEDTEKRYFYWSEAGRNVDIYIIDTGIKLDHPEFLGRASNFRGWRTSPYIDGPDSTMNDTHVLMHGTCVASIAGGTLIGTGKEANIINVKAWRRQGGWSSIIRAVKYNEALAIAIRKAKRAGIPFVTGAGNNNEDARDTFPCNLDETICVASTDERYRKANDSNYGRHVTVSAPGDGPLCATVRDNDFTYRYTSGTSPAAAYVAGTLAHFISYEKIRSNTELVMKRMRDNWNINQLEGFPESTPNTFNNNGFLNQYKSVLQPYAGAPEHEKSAPFQKNTESEHERPISG